MSLLSGKGLSKRFKNRLVLGNVHIEIARGSAIGIAGSTGSGKSTLLKILLNHRVQGIFMLAK